MPPYRPLSPLDGDFSPFFFVCFVVLIATTVALFCIGTGTGKAKGKYSSLCSNKLHKLWLGKEPEDYSEFAHPKPSKEILCYFDSRRAKNPKYCEECVQYVKDLIKTAVDDAAGPSSSSGASGSVSIPALASAIQQTPQSPGPQLDEETVTTTTTDIDIVPPGSSSVADIPFEEAGARPSQIDSLKSSLLKPSLTTSYAPSNPDRRLPTTTTKHQGTPYLYGDKDRHQPQAPIPVATPQEFMFPDAIPGWIQHTLNAAQVIYIQLVNVLNFDPIIQKTLTVSRTGRTVVRVFGREVTRLVNKSVGIQPMTTMTPIMTANLLSAINSMNVCSGNPDPRYHRLARASDGHIAGGFLFKDDFVTWNRANYKGTIRSVACPVLIPNNIERCHDCKAHGGSLRSMFSRASKQQKSSPRKRTSASSHVPLKYLAKEEVASRVRKSIASKRLLQRRVQRLEKKLEVAFKKEQIEIQTDMSSALKAIMDEESPRVEGMFKEGTFQRLFWEQQKKAFKTRDKRGHRWHPMMIKWALNLRLSSPKGYKTILNSGVLRLPGMSTLADYTHYTEATSGFSVGKLEQLLEEINFSKLQPYQKFVTVVHDEMKIKSDLVYDKTTGKLVGFTDLGNVLNDLRTYQNELNKKTAPEHNLAKYMLVFMVRGFFYNFTYPFAAFPTSCTKSDEIFNLTWQAIEALEMAGLKVMAITCDGAATNRCFYDMHGPKNNHTNQPVYKCANIYASPEYPRDVHLFCDPPHLIKCVRNAWANSFAHTKTRMLWFNGNISWQIIEDLFNTQGRMKGLYMVNLTYDHVHLTAFSKMKVSLAAQVMSQSVANAIKKLKGPSAAPAITFVETFDKFFDCLNVRSTREGFTKKKDNLLPYKTIDDPRLQWLKQDFIKYLDDWEKCVRAKTSISRTEQNKMMIPNETLIGLRRTALAFADLAQFLLQEDGVKFLLSERINQDALESLFGNQRQMKGGNEAPNVNQFNVALNANRMKSSQNLKVVGGNVKRKSGPLPVDDSKLPKRKRVRKSTKEAPF